MLLIAFPFETRERERLPGAIRYYNQFTLRPPNSTCLASTPINEFRSRREIKRIWRGLEKHKEAAASNW